MRSCGEKEGKWEQQLYNIIIWQTKSTRAESQGKDFWQYATARTTN